MSPRRWAPALVGVLALAGPSAAGGEERRIAQGVRAGGVELSGLTVDEAAARLRDELRPALARPVRVSVGHRRFVLTTRTARVRFDPTATARRAYYLGRRAQETGDPAAPVSVRVELVLGHSAAAVRAWTARLAAGTGRSARSASARVELRRVVRRPARPGRRVDAARLAAQIDRALSAPGRPRTLRAETLVVRPPVTDADLARRYRTVITVDRNRFVLRLFKRFRVVRRYGVAVGRAGLETPTGLYSITSRQVDPAWHVPNRAWAGPLAGTVVPGGAPNNPLKARWLGITDGVGIHGTAESFSIGSRASHGCVRMRVRDVVRLYPKVPLGTPVLIR